MYWDMYMGLRSFGSMIEPKGTCVISAYCDKLPVRRLSAARPEVFNGCMQLRLRHLDQCSAWVKICEVINYGRNKSIGNAPWSPLTVIRGGHSYGQGIRTGFFK